MNQSDSNIFMNLFNKYYNITILELPLIQCIPSTFCNSLHISTCDWPGRIIKWCSLGSLSLLDVLIIKHPARINLILVCVQVVLPQPWHSYPDSLLHWSNFCCFSGQLDLLLTSSCDATHIAGLAGGLACEPSAFHLNTIFKFSLFFATRKKEKNYQK